MTVHTPECREAQTWASRTVGNQTHHPSFHTALGSHPQANIHPESLPPLCQVHDVQIQGNARLMTSKPTQPSFSLWTKGHGNQMK